MKIVRRHASTESHTTRRQPTVSKSRDRRSTMQAADMHGNVGLVIHGAAAHTHTCARASLYYIQPDAVFNSAGMPCAVLSANASSKYNFHHLTSSKTEMVYALYMTMLMHQEVLTTSIGQQPKNDPKMTCLSTSGSATQLCTYVGGPVIAGEFELRFFSLCHFQWVRCSLTCTWCSWEGGLAGLSMVGH